MPRLEFLIASSGYHLQASSLEQVLSVADRVPDRDKSMTGCPLPSLPITLMFNFASSFTLLRNAGPHGNQWDALLRKRALP